MKHLIMFLLLGAASPSFAIDYSFQQAPFTITAVLKTGATKVQVFQFNGSALFTDSSENYYSTTGQITLRRNTFACDDVSYSYSDDYYCSFYSAKFLTILDAISNHDDNFNAVRDIVSRYYNNSYSYDSFKISLGRKGQTSETQSTKSIMDPSNSNNRVDFTISTTGMRPL